MAFLFKKGSRQRRRDTEDSELSEDPPSRSENSKPRDSLERERAGRPQARQGRTGGPGSSSTSRQSPPNASSPSLDRMPNSGAPSRDRPNMPGRPNTSPPTRSSTAGGRGNAGGRSGTPPRATSPPRANTSPGARSNASRSPARATARRSPPSRGGTSRSSSVKRRNQTRRRLARARQKKVASDDEEIFDEEWIKKSSRARRFTMHSRPELHDGAQRVIDDSLLHETELEESMAEVMDCLEEMEEHISELKQRKDEEENESDVDDDDELTTVKSRSVKSSKESFPLPGSKPRVTFKPEFFEIRSGWLWKKGDKRTNWSKRFFKIHLDDPHSLYYYKTPNAAELDAPKRRTSRTGKRINLLFAHAYTPRSRVYHKNKKIASEFEFLIQTKESNNRSFGRQYNLAAERADDLELWLRTLNYIEEQTDKCIQEHQDAIKRGRFTRLKKMDKHEYETKWDKAQNFVAYGPGLFEGTAGSVVEFTIQCNDHLGNPEKFGGLSNKISVVLESQDLHYDLEVEDNEDGTYTVQYLPTRIGEYELSVLVDECDVYGSPFHPRIDPAPLSAVHCFAEGAGVFVGILNQVNTFVVHLRNRFEESVLSDNVKFNIVCSDIVDCVGEPVSNGDGTYTIQYNVKATEEELKEMKKTSQTITAEISVMIDDGNNTPSFPRHIIGSPFKPGIAVTNSSEAIAAAQAASKLTKVGQPMTSPRLNDTSFSSGSTTMPLSPEQKILWDVIVSNQIPTVSDIVLPKSTTMSEHFPINTAEPSPVQENNTTIHNTSNDFGGSSGRGGHQFEGITGEFSPYLPIHKADSIDPMLHNTTTDTVESKLNSPFQQKDIKMNDSDWLPESNESDLVRQSLLDRAKQIQIEKEQLLEKRRSLTQQVQANESIQRSQNVLDESVLPLFDKHSIVLSRVFENYAKEGKIEISEFLRLAQDYDVTPTFLTRKEIKQIYNSTSTQQQHLGLQDFNNALALIAVTALSKPMFAHLYNTKAAKVNVLLNMWGVADPTKLSEIQNQKAQWA